MEIPKRLYHATTSRSKAIKIMLNGFNTEHTFFFTKPEHTIEFMNLYHGEGTYTVIEVDTSKLDVNRLEQSEDHNPVFFSKDLQAYVYIGEISKKAITTNFVDYTINKK